MYLDEGIPSRTSDECVVNLRKVDILTDRSQLFIRSARGTQDRYTLLSEKLKILLAEYLKAYKPFYWLFEAQDHGQYLFRSVQWIFRDAVQDSGKTHM